MLSEMPSKSVTGADGPSSSPFIPQIDGLKGLAILMVMATHIADHGIEGPWRYSFLQAFFAAGERGVQLFFLISGFAIFVNSRERMGREKNPWACFYVRRWFRILPLWWFVVFLFSLVFALRSNVTLAWMSFYFGFVSFDMDWVIPVLPGWSLFVEESFYLLFPLVFPWLLTARKTLGLFIFSLLVSWSWQLLAPRYGVSEINNFVFWFPLTQWFCFPLGVLLYHWNRPQEPANSAFLNGIILTLLPLSQFLGFVPATFGQAGLIYLALQPATWLHQITKASPLRFFGRRCYSLYLTHLFLICFFRSYFRALFARLGISLPFAEVEIVLKFGVYALICVAVATLLYILVEKPTQILGRIFVERWQNQLHPVRINT